MKKNAENFSNETKLSPILKKVADILKMDEKEILKLEELEIKKWLQKTIEEIISQHKNNKKLVKMLLQEYRGNIFSILDKKLKNNKEIALLAVANSSNNFYSLDTKLQKDLDILKQLVKSFIREWLSFLEFENFVESFLEKDSKTKQLLYNFYQKQLNLYSNIYLKEDLSWILLIIKKKNKDFYEVLKKHRVIISKWKKTIINPKFVENIFKQFKKENIVFENFEDKKNFVFLMIWRILKIDINLLDEDSLAIFENIFNIFFSLENKELVKEKIQKETKKNNEDKKEEDNQEENFKEDENVENDFNDILDFCLPACNYSHNWETYEINLWENKKIKLTKEEQESFNTQALKNFIKFYNTFYELGLNFLWDKYKNSFIILLKNKLDFDYRYWAWFTDWRILGLLNLISKNIWVPEKEIIEENWENWEKKKKWVCFKSLEAAKLAFSEIKETGKINWEVYSDLWVFSRGAVENKLILDWKIDVDRGELNISKW